MAVNSSGEDGARFRKEYNNSPLLEDNHEPPYFINNTIFPRLRLPTTINVSESVQVTSYPLCGLCPYSVTLQIIPRPRP